jgi:hypothetical protein
MMKYYKPLLYSAVSIIYVSFAFRVVRLALIPRMISQKREPKA